MNPTIIYILGAGNSGSTLLSMVLGGHSEISSIGELIALDRWHADGRPCSCGKPLSTCERWGNIVNNDELRSVMPVKPCSSGFQALLSGFSDDVIRKDRHYPETVRRNLDLYKKLADIDDVKYLVDSSKDPLHLFYLRKSGLFRIVPVLLVRRGEEYMESALKRGSSRNKAIRRWVYLNNMARQFIKKSRLSESVIHVRYQDLVCNSESVLTRILKAVDLAFEPQMLNYYRGKHHNLAGTRTRFHPRPIDPEAYRGHSLSLLDVVCFQLAGGKIWNRYFRA